MREMQIGEASNSVRVRPTKGYNFNGEMRRKKVDKLFFYNIYKGSCKKIFFNEIVIGVITVF